MPTRVRNINFTDLVAAGQLANGTDFILASKGTRVEQIAVVTLPATATGLVGIKVGATGDPLRLNAQGQVFNLTEDVDRLGGVWLVWMGGGSNPSGIGEFAVATAAGG